MAKAAITVALFPTPKTRSAIRLTARCSVSHHLYEHQQFKKALAPEDVAAPVK
jgi:hypothetical protein